VEKSPGSRSTQSNLQWNRVFRLRPQSAGFLRRSGAGRTSRTPKMLRPRQRVHGCDKTAQLRVSAD